MTSIQRPPDYWYVTDDEGMKFFCEEEQLTSAEWRSRAPEDKVGRLERDLSDNPSICAAPFKQ
jgi:hypothetical protein